MNEETELLRRENALLRQRMKRNFFKSWIACGVLSVSLLSLGFAYFLQAHDLSEMSEMCSGFVSAYNSETAEHEKTRKALAGAKQRLDQHRGSCEHDLRLPERMKGRE